MHIRDNQIRNMYKMLAVLKKKSEVCLSLAINVLQLMKNYMHFAANQNIQLLPNIILSILHIVILFHHNL